MKKTRRKFTAAFKTKVVLETIKERYSVAELARKFELHPTQIGQWKSEFLGNAEQVFSKTKKADTDAKEQEIDKLYSKIGKLQVERDFLKKSLVKLEHML